MQCGVVPVVELLFPQRIARVSYLVRSFMVGTTADVTAMHLIDFDGNSPSTQGFVVVIALIVYWGAWVARARIADLAMSGWFTLLLLVPGANIFLASYMAWGRTKLRATWPATPQTAPGNLSDPVKPTAPASAGTVIQPHAETLRRLEALLEDGTLSAEQFERMKARHGL